MIKELKVEKLFGQFNYDIKFNPSGITIITGPNGFGKSTILKIIATIAEKDLYELIKFSFSSIEIILNSKKLLIERKRDKIVINNVILEIPNQRIINNWEKRNPFPYIERIDFETYIDLRNDKILSADDMQLLRLQSLEGNSINEKLISINYEMAKRSKKEIVPLKELDEYLANFKKEIGTIKFIKEQRLLRQESIEDSRFYAKKQQIAVEVIGEIPKKVQEQIKNVVLKYSEVSSKLDSTYPKRLFSAEKELTQEEFIKQIGEIVSKQENIQEFNIINDLKIVSTEYNGAFSKALRVYLDDTKAKLEVFDELIKKLNLFTSIINKKLNFKKVVVSNDFGLKVVRDDESSLDLSTLSSGEQQIIVLYYELIFGVKDKLIILIDEPEISLHVAWQRELMKDFNEIISLKNDSLNVIIATHAPQVINENWNLVVDLGEQNGLY